MSGLGLWAPGLRFRIQAFGSRSPKPSAKTDRPGLLNGSFPTAKSLGFRAQGTLNPKPEGLGFRVQGRHRVSGLLGLGLV